MVATNGHRLSATHVRCDNTAQRTDDLIIHPAALALVANLAAKGDQRVSVAHTQNHTGFRAAAWEVISRLIEGPYPDWRTVVPKDNDREITMDRLAFLTAVRRMWVLAEGQTHRIRLSLHGASMTLSFDNAGVGEGDQQVAVDYDGDPIEIGFNAEYLLGVLGAIQATEVRMTLKAPERAATLHPVVGEDDAGAIVHDVLVMPLRLL